VPRRLAEGRSADGAAGTINKTGFLFLVVVGAVTGCATLPTRRYPVKVTGKDILIEL
jgi:hypothetical protein